MKGFIEKGYGWPAFIVLLLVSSVVMMGLVVIAARSDGGAQVVSDYYEQAVQWDSVATLRDAAVVRGLSARLDMEPADGAWKGRVTIQDTTGTTVTFPSARITLSRPQYAESELETEALPMEGSPVLEFRVDLQGAGLRDIRAVVADSEGSVQFSWRREF